jgi:hypothetical protein
MTTPAWIFMGAAWAVIIGMTGYCFYKLMTSKQKLGGD